MFANAPTRSVDNPGWLVACDPSTGCAGCAPAIGDRTTGASRAEGCSGGACMGCTCCWPGVALCDSTVGFAVKLRAMAFCRLK